MVASACRGAPHVGDLLPAQMKTTLSELAICGGTPEFAEPLHVGRPNLGNRRHFLARVRSMLDRRWLTNNGPFVRELEAALEAQLGVPHCVAVCNATIGMQLLVRALGLTGEVILPSFTFVASAHALAWEGLTPVFCDVEPGGHNIDPVSVRALVTSTTSAILGVHLWGRPCRVEELQAIADEHRLELIFDAAHALGCSHRGSAVGTFGRAEVFSFHATKFVNSFEGGAITTIDSELAAKLRLMRNFGFSDYDTVEMLGTNAKMSEVSAAMALTSLEAMPRTVMRNRRNLLLYEELLGRLPGIRVVKPPEDTTPNYQYVVIEVDQARNGIARDALLACLWKEGILARRYFYPGCHLMSPYVAMPGRDPLKETSLLTHRVMVLPTGTAVQPAQIRAVASVIQLAVLHGPEISRLVDCQEKGAVWAS